MFKVEQKHSGQYRRYGDSFYEYDIETEESKEAVIDYCLTNLAKMNVPSEDVWRKNIRRGGEHQDDYAYYFRGYYKLKKTEYGYYFTYVRPCTE